jgi:hypothetical protein
MNGTVTPISAAKRPMRAAMRATRVSWWPLGAALSLPLLDIGAQAMSGNLFLPLLALEVPLFLVWAAVSLWALSVAILALSRRAWRRAAVAAIYPALVLLTVFLPGSVKQVCNEVADVARFACLRSFYERQVAQLPRDQHRLAVFEMGGSFAATRGIVYDESDQILRDPARQSPDWKKRADMTELGCPYVASRLPGPPGWSRHWYLASFLGC